MNSEDMKWYVAHTYSGHEKKAVKYLESAFANAGPSAANSVIQGSIAFLRSSTTTQTHPPPQFSLIHSAALSSPMRSLALRISSAAHACAASTIPRRRRL